MGSRFLQALEKSLNFFNTIRVQTLFHFILILQYTFCTCTAVFHSHRHKWTIVVNHINVPVDGWAVFFTNVSKIASNKSLWREICSSMLLLNFKIVIFVKKCNFWILYFCLNQICHWFWWHGCRIKQEKNDSTCCVPGALQGQCAEDSWLAINHHFIMELDSHSNKNS